MPTEPQIFGLAAEFGTPEEILRAAREVRAAGYLQAEAYTPFPIEGLPESLGFRKTRLPAICFWGGLIGAAGGYLMCWYANVISYPWNIGGRPLNSWPAFLSIMIDVMLGCAFLFVLIALIVLNGLPRLNHPMFNLDEFSRATQTRYFLCIESSDKKFDVAATRSFLAALQPLAIYPVPK